MNDKLINKLEALNLTYDSYREYMSSVNDPFSEFEEEITSSKEYQDKVSNIRKPKISSKLDNLEIPIKPKFNPPFKYNDSLHEVEFMSYKECFPESLKDILDRENKLNPGINKIAKDDVIKKIGISAIFTLITLFFLGFPYIFNWHISVKIIFTIIGVIIFCFHLRFDSDPRITISYELTNESFFKKIFLRVPLNFHIWYLISGKYEYKFDLHREYSCTIEDRKKYLNYRFPDWYGYPYRVSDLDKDEFKLLYSNEELNQSYGSNDKKGFPFCDGVDKNELVIFPVQSVIEHMKNPKRITEYGTHYAPGAYWTYRDRETEYSKKLKQDEKMVEYNEKIEAVKDEVKKILIEKRKNQYKKDIAEIENEYPDEYIGEKYFSDLPRIIDLIKSGRADTAKEAINLLEVIKYNERQLELQRKEIEENQRLERERLYAEQQRYEYEQKRLRAEQQNNANRTYKVRVNTSKDRPWIGQTVSVNARSEAEAINAAMNMVAGAISAEIQRF